MSGRDHNQDAKRVTKRGVSSDSGSSQPIVQIAQSAVSNINGRSANSLRSYSLVESNQSDKRPGSGQELAVFGRPQEKLTVEVGLKTRMDENPDYANPELEGSPESFYES